MKQTDLAVRILQRKISTFTSWSLFFISAPYFFIFYLIKPILGFPVLFLDLCFLLVPILNRQSRTAIANWILILAANFGCFFYVLMLGLRINVHLLFIPFAIFSFVLFPLSQKKSVLLGMILPIVLEIISVFFVGQDTIYFSFQMAHFIAVASIICVTFLTMLCVFYFAYLLTQYGEQLSYSNQELLDTQRMMESVSQQAAMGSVMTGIAHEMKSPVASVDYYAHQLLDANSKYSKEEIAHHLKALSQRMVKLFGCLLRDKTQLSNDQEPIEINALFKTIWGMVISKADHKVTLDVVYATHTPMILGTEVYIVQAIVNLLVNAFAHTKAGSVTLYSHYDPAIAQVAIFIEDTGEGMSPEVSAQIFESGQSSRKSHLNAGIGLTFVKRVADVHGATLEVTSVVGKGSIFKLGFKAGPMPPTPTPAEPISDKPSIQQESINTSQYHVLIVDDEPIVLERLGQLVGQCGHVPVMAQDGQEGLDLLDQHPHIAVILLDYQLPGMSGLEFIEEKNKRPNLANIPVLMCTNMDPSSVDQLAWAQTTGRVKGFLPKILTLEVLRKAFEEVLVFG